MKIKVANRGFTALAIAVLTAAMLAFSLPTAHAADSDSANYVLSQATYKQVQEVQKLLGHKKYAQAIAHAKALMARAKKESKYAEALTNQLIAQGYLLQNKLDASEPYLKRIVALDALQPRAQRSAIQQLATVYLSQEQYSKAISLYKEVLAQAEANKETPNPVFYYHIGLAYSMQEQYQQASRYIEEAIQKRETAPVKKGEKRKPVPKDWYANYFIVVYKLKDYRKANDLAKMLVAKWPNDNDFWNYYANTFLLLHDDRSATAVYALMNKRGMLKEKSDYMQLISLYVEQKTPYKAAALLTEVMDKGIVPKNRDNYALLASTWMQAKSWDKALDALGKEAALAPSGQIYLQQASIYMSKLNYGKAADAARNALQKGGLKHPGQAWMLLGQAAFRSHDKHTALNAFHRAANYGSERKDALGWIKYVNASGKNGAGG
ncbi:MAG: tetratricopeptide repeat protein [Gammaproteobacteria bacterium]